METILWIINGIGRKYWEICVDWGTKWTNIKRVEIAPSKIKNNKALGSNHVVVEMLKTQSE